MADITELNDDEKLLAELGYKQELNRSWSGFQNFAISFSIISILAGCFTTFGVAWNNGGPIAISWGWPILSAFILLVGFMMSELVSAYPTSAGIYWWASKLGGPRAGFYTGWLNLIGLLGIIASVVYAAASFLNITLSLFFPDYLGSFLGGDTAHQQFFWFIVLMILVTVLNLFRTEILGMINNVSVWWHVIGAAVIILILIFGPSEHQSFSFVFTETFNNSGFDDGATGGVPFWFYVLPLGFLLTQYTITGYDASAHLSEETQGAANGAAKGIWRSIFYSAVGGYVLLLAFLFAANNPDAINESALDYGGFTVAGIFANSPDPDTVQDRDGHLHRRPDLLLHRLPDVHLPHDVRVQPGRRGARILAVGSRQQAQGAGLRGHRGRRDRCHPHDPGTVPLTRRRTGRVLRGGLHRCHRTVRLVRDPDLLRWRLGDGFQQGSWNLGNHYKWMAPLALIEIAVTSIYFLLPTSPAGTPGNPDFTWNSVNYTPIVVLGVLLAITVWWAVSAKNWFTGPKNTINLPAGVSSADEIALEHHHDGYLTGEHQAHHPESGQQ